MQVALLSSPLPHSQYCLIHAPLLRGVAAVNRPRARHVRGVAKVLAPSIHQHGLATMDLRGTRHQTSNIRRGQMQHLLPAAPVSRPLDSWSHTRLRFLGVLPLCQPLAKHGGSQATRVTCQVT